MKKRFYVYASWEEQMELLSVDEKATMLMNLFNYQKNEEPILDTPMLKMCWASMKFLLEKDTKAYDASVERGRQAGKQNNKTPHTTTQPHTAPFNAVSTHVDNDNVNVNENGNGNGNGNGNKNWETLQMLKWDEMRGDAETRELYQYETKMGVV